MQLNVISPGPPSISTLSCVGLSGDVSGAVNVTESWTPRGPPRRVSVSVRDFEIHWISRGFRILDWISGFHVDFWISKWIYGFHVDFWISRGFPDFKVDFYILDFV